MIKFFDANLNRDVITIYPGELYVSQEPGLISTILGSCVSIILFDSSISLGGINHYMLAKTPPRHKDDGTMPLTRFGECALKQLVLEMQKKGASISNLKAKIFGGSNVLNFSSKSEDLIGDDNIQFAREALKELGIPIVKEDVGGSFSRKIIFEPRTFKVMLKRTRVSEKR